MGARARILYSMAFCATSLLTVVGLSEADDIWCEFESTDWEARQACLLDGVAVWAEGAHGADRRLSVWCAGNDCAGTPFYGVAFGNSNSNGKWCIARTDDGSTQRSPAGACNNATKYTLRMMRK